MAAEPTPPTHGAAGAIPAELTIETLGDPRLHLRTPLRVTVEREGEHVTVWQPELEELGYGPDLAAAVEDFQQTVVELYGTLRAEQGRLGPEMVRLWTYLDQHVEERP
jgi:hypothetical protein